VYGPQCGSTPAQPEGPGIRRLESR
jgi:hypothetical protein